MAKKGIRGKSLPDLTYPAHGLKCPHGCKVEAWRMYGMIRHLMEVHDYTEEAAWKILRKKSKK